jgi:hypothetical protein
VLIAVAAGADGADVGSVQTRTLAPAAHPPYLLTWTASPLTVILPHHPDVWLHRSAPANWLYAGGAAGANPDVVDEFLAHGADTFLIDAHVNRTPTQWAPQPGNSACANRLQRRLG